MVKEAGALFLECLHDVMETLAHLRLSAGEG